MNSQALDYMALAQEARGNWLKFTAFAWRDRPKDASDWTIVYTVNRDSGLIDQSNAAAIDQLMASFCDGEDPDARHEHHRHWACGWAEGYAIRVLRNGVPTPAFRTWCGINERLKNYPLLDEDDHTRREVEAALDAIKGQSCALFDNEPPKGWENQVYSWLWENAPHELENHDDQGAAPRRESIRAAIKALGFLLFDDCENEIP